MRKKLLAIDGNSILNRAFYGIRPLTTKDGFSTNALYGMVTMIGKQYDALKPDYCAVAFDRKEPTFRHLKYGAYKAGRRPMPPELAMQLPVAKELSEAMGAKVLELAGYEADDILGTLARLADEDDVEAYLLTGDRDSLQLISDHVHILLATNTETVDTDREVFFARYGVNPEQFVDVKALMGDSSDNIPGVPGIGEKTALKLIADFGSLDGVYENLPTAKHTPSVRAKLEGGKESAYLSRELATICRTVPIVSDLSEIECRGMDREGARRLFLRLEFSAFIKRYGLDALAPQKAPERNGNDSADPAKTPAASSDTPAADAAQDLPFAGEISLAGFLADCQTVALDYADGWILSNGKNLLRVSEPLDSVVRAVGERETVVYDCKTLYKIPGGKALGSLPNTVDLMLAAYLCNAGKSEYPIDRLLADYLGVLPPDGYLFVSSFLPLWAELKKRLTETRQLSLLSDVEMPLAGVLSDMEEAGFRVDKEGIAAYGEQLDTVARDLESRIWFHAGKEFNINSPKQLGEVLFETLGLPHAKKTKTGYSTNAEILEKLRYDHPIVDDILEYRQVTKLKSTYCDGLCKVADENGRVHTTFKQTGTATGRLSSTEPNLQNIPIRTELGRELRRFFLPENSDYVIVDADYSQIELRLLADVSGDENLIAAFRSGADIHSSTAAAVFGVPIGSVTPEMRKKAKAVNFGIMYGIGAFSLADDIHVSRAEAQEFIDTYLARYPGIDAYLKKTIADASETGYVTTRFGRRREIPELLGTNKMQKKFGERVAMNSPIQGTAADIIKIAMIRVHQRLKAENLDARLILQVHDELLIEANRKCAEAAKTILKEEMENAVSCRVPLDVEVQIGDTWFDAK